MPRRFLIQTILVLPTQPFFLRRPITPPSEILPSGIHPLATHRSSIRALVIHRSATQASETRQLEIPRLATRQLEIHRSETRQLATSRSPMPRTKLQTREIRQLPTQ